jgi:uncharacterized protein YyaL (SSP411 family)
MSAANIITGSGGWPLNCFAMPDGKPFHAGTYFPKDQWLNLLQTVSAQFSSNRDKLQEYANKLTNGIRMQETAISDNSVAKLNSQTLNLAIQGWKDKWDFEEGGMKRVPKFPMPANYEFLMKWNHFNNDKEVAQFTKLTLHKMAFGGIFDQIGGGFSRYSTDGLWKAPHFEKMLYDNAQLMKVYALAYSKDSDPVYKEVMEKTVTWLEREMLDESGLFYSALDADSEGEEGKFYVWKANELEAVIGGNYDLARVIYQVGGKGLWEHGNNILLREHTNEQIANLFKISEQEVKNKLEEINTALLAARDKRIRPGLDDKCLTSWNGLMIEGLCEAYRVTKNQKHLDLAVNCGNALLKYQMTKEGVLHSYKGGKSTIDGMLEDFVYPAIGFLKLYETTSDERYYSAALSLTEMAMSDFYDTEKQLFYFNKENELILRTSEVYDNVIPSTNSAMANLLTQIGLLEGNPLYLSIAEDMIGKIQGTIANYPGGFAYWSVAHLMHTQPYYEIAVVGKNAEAIKSELLSVGLTNALIVGTSKKSDRPIFKNRFVKGKTLIYVCQKGVCSAPVELAADVLKLMAN